MIAHALLLRPSDSIPVQFPHRHRIPKPRPIPAADDVRVQCRSDCRGTRGNSARERERERGYRGNYLRLRLRLRLHLLQQHCNATQAGKRGKRRKGVGEWEGLVHRDIVIGIGIDYRDPSRLLFSLSARLSSQRVPLSRLQLYAEVHSICEVRSLSRPARQPNKQDARG